MELAKEKRRHFLYRWFWPKEFFFNMFFISLYSVLNTLSEYTYFYLSKNITSYIFLLFRKIIESLQCIMKHYWAIQMPGVYNITEFYKCLNVLSPEIMSEILAVSKRRYNTRHYNLFLWLIGPKLIDMVAIQFHIELIRYGTYCPVK